MLGAAEGDSLINGEKELASLGFDVVTSTTAEVAELAKLACNTWRDVIFAYSNELALMGEIRGVSALEAYQHCKSQLCKSKHSIAWSSGRSMLIKRCLHIFGSGPGQSL